MTARKPVAGWRSDEHHDELRAGPFILRVWGRLDGWRGHIVAEPMDGLPIIFMDVDGDDENEAKFAAEDAARALLLGGLASLAPGMPEGWTLTALRINGEPGHALTNERDGDDVYLRADEVTAVALGMLAAVRGTK